jgi:hypothetical protein
MRLFALLLVLSCGKAGGFPTDGGPRPDTGPRPDGGTNGGLFTESVIDESIVHGQAVDIVDIDGDGDRDVLVALSLTDAVYLYVNEGNAGSWSTVPIGTGIVAMKPEAVDLDGDGDLDIATVGLFERAGGPGEVTWYENNAGAWTERSITGSTFSGPLFIEAADLSGDGLADLVVGSVEFAGAGRGLWWFRNTGGAFEGPTAIDENLRDVRSIQLADLDADGMIDVLCAARTSGEIAWYENSAGTFTKNAIAAIGGPTDVQLANLDGDAELEVIVLANELSWFDPPGWTKQTIAASFPSADTSRVVAADFTGDGAIDLATTTTMMDGVLTLYENSGGSFTPKVVQTGYRGLNFVSAGDLDGDGRPDLLTTTYGHTDSTDVISWWRAQ